MRQKKQMKMLGLLGLLAALPIISACAGNKGSDESRKEKMVQSVSVRGEKRCVSKFGRSENI